MISSRVCSVNDISKAPFSNKATFTGSWVWDMDKSFSKGGVGLRGWHSTHFSADRANHKQRSDIVILDFLEGGVGKLRIRDISWSLSRAKHLPWFLTFCLLK